MKFILLLVFLFMFLANPITGGKLFPGFNNPEKWMKRAIRKLQRKSSSYGLKIASNTDDISNNAGFISSMAACDSGYINDPDYGLRCCFEDTNNVGQCLCDGTNGTIDDVTNPGTCCFANVEHPDNCLCSGTNVDDPSNPGNCCFEDTNNLGQCLCNAANYIDDPNKKCFNLDWKADGICDDKNNHGGCDFDGGDCCGKDVDTDLCTLCQCLEEEAPLPNVVGCCFEDSNNPGECLCTGTNIDDPDNAGSCCLDDEANPGNCFECDDSTTCSGNGTCIGNTGYCECNSGFTGDGCDIATCPGKPICSDKGTCPEGGTVCQCEEENGNADCSPAFYLMVTCGEPSAKGVRTEVINVVDDSVVCADLADYPAVQSYPPLGGVVDGKVIVCGGHTKTQGGGWSDECFAYVEGAWVLHATMDKPRYWAAGTVMKGNVENGTPDKLWIVAGENNIKTTQYIYADGTVEFGPEIPNGDEAPCLVGLDNGDAFILGRWDGRKEVYHFNGASETWTKQEDLLQSRTVSACTWFYSPKHDLRPVIYIGGGAGSSNTAEYLDYTVTETWEQLPNLPTGTNEPRAVPTPDRQGVLHIYGSKIYELTCDSSACTWETRPQQFTTDFQRTKWFQAMYIPAELATCGKKCAKIYQDTYSGWEKMIQETSMLDLTGNEDNDASSVRVYPGCTLKLFSEHNNVGLLDSLTADVSFLSAYNDQVSSLSCTCQD